MDTSDQESQSSLQEFQRWGNCCDIAQRFSSLGLLTAIFAVLLFILVYLTSVFWNIAPGMLASADGTVPLILRLILVLLSAGIVVALSGTLVMRIASRSMMSLDVTTTAKATTITRGERIGDMRCTVIETDNVKFIPLYPRMALVSWRAGGLVLLAILFLNGIIGPFYATTLWKAIKNVVVGLLALSFVTLPLKPFSGGWELLRVDRRRVLRVAIMSLGQKTRWLEVPLKKVTTVEASQGAGGHQDVEIELSDLDGTGQFDSHRVVLATLSRPKNHAQWKAQKIVELIRLWKAPDQETRV